MDDIKKLRADIIIALLSNPNHTPHITHFTENSLASTQQPTEPINESTIAIAEALIQLVESNNNESISDMAKELSELVDTGKELIQALSLVS